MVNHFHASQMDPSEIFLTKSSFLINDKCIVYCFLPRNAKWVIYNINLHFAWMHCTLWNVAFAKNSTMKSEIPKNVKDEEAASDHSIYIFGQIAVNPLLNHWLKCSSSSYEALIYSRILDWIESLAIIPIKCLRIVQIGVTQAIPTEPLIGLILTMSATTLAFPSWYKISISYSDNNSSHLLCRVFKSFCVKIYFWRLWLGKNMKIFP